MPKVIEQYEALDGEIFPSMEEAIKHEQSLVYTQPVGLWHVSTEGDCEGRTVRKLGEHHGHIADIAFALADSASYKLTFRRVAEEVPKELVDSGKSEVHVCIENPKGGYISNDKVVQSMIGTESGIKVSQSNYYQSLKFSRKKNDCN